MIKIFIIFFFCLGTVKCVGFSLADFQNVTVCEGAKSPTTGIPKHITQWMKHLYLNCTHVEGHLIISNLKESDDISFLSTIRSVAGTLIIENNTRSLISLPNLKIVHGQFPLTHPKRRPMSVYIYNNRGPKGKDGIMDFRSLRSVVRHDIYLKSNRGFCYLNKVNWSELLEDFSAQIVQMEPIGNCNKTYSCSSRCPDSISKSKGCWGPQEQQCQQSASCEDELMCGATRRCYANRRRCCNRECAGGCSGSGADHCYACRNSRNSTTCLKKCPPKHNYINKVMVDNPDYLLNIGLLCTKKCPSNYIEHASSCVKICPKDFAVVDRKCKPCAEIDIYSKDMDNCRSNCHMDHLIAKVIEEKPYIAGETRMYNKEKKLAWFTWRSLFKKLVNCTRLQARDGIIVKARSNNAENGDEAVRAEDFDNLRNLREIYGYLYFDLDSYPTVQNMTFLSNLEMIVSSDEKKGLTIQRSKGLRFLGLRKLRQISIRQVRIQLNDQLCFHENLETGLRQISKEKNVDIRISKNRNSSLCQQEKRVCDRNCRPTTGCWGLGPEMCVACQSMRAGNVCVDECRNSIGYYKNASNSKECEPCHPECLKCTGPGPNNCDGKCKNWLYGSTCVNRCPRTTYPLVKERSCKPCNAMCLNDEKLLSPVCSGPSDKPAPGGCNKCLYIEISKKKKMRCLRKKPKKYFFCDYLRRTNVERSFPFLKNYSNSDTLVCQPCYENCETCINNNDAKSCETCKPGFLYYDGKGCYPKCPIGSFQQGSECRECVSGCKICNGSSIKNCSTCNTYRIYTDLEKGEFVCNNTCPPNMPTPIFSRQTADNVCEKISSATFYIIGGVIGLLLILLILIPIVVIVCERRRRAQILKEREIVISKYSRRLEEEMVPLSATDAKPNFGKLKIISVKRLSKGAKIGSGAFGTVYRGVWKPDVENGEREVKIDVAIKELKNTNSTNASKEMLTEAHVMASVNNHHCVHLLGVSLTSPMQLISVYVSLGNLTSYMPKHKHELPSRLLLTWALQIATGMDYLESLGIVHRDLAARNVLLERVDWVRITDFGLAKLVDPGGSGALTIKSGKLPIQWLAIECLTDFKFSHKSDVWAFGVTLWEIFTFASQRPYSGKSIRHILDYLENGDRLEQPETCTLDLYMLLLKCWVIEEEGRPTFQELIEELRMMTADPSRYLSTPMDVGEGKNAPGRKKLLSSVRVGNEYFEPADLTDDGSVEYHRPCTSKNGLPVEARPQGDDDSDNDESGYLLPDLQERAPPIPEKRKRDYQIVEPNSTKNKRPASKGDDGYTIVTSEV